MALSVAALAALLLSSCGAGAPPASERPPARADPTVTAAQAPTQEPARAASPTRAPTATPWPYRLQPGDLVLAATEDSIPAILPDPDLYVSAERGDQEWNDDEPVIGVEVDGQARAYPIRILSNHEIVNDTVGGEPLAVTWCPLCYTAIVFSRSVQDRTITFGVSGYLFNSNLVMYDHQTGTLWSQILGQSLRGAYRDQFLRHVPSRLVSWGDWKSLHPDTTVLSAQQLGQRAEDVVDPYTGYYTSGAAGLAERETDERLPAKQLVVGLSLGNEAVAYPLDQLRGAGPVHDVVDGEPILLAYLESLDSVSVFHRQLDDRTLSFHDHGLSLPFVEDVQTQSQWDLISGEAVEGPLVGERLTRHPAQLVFWFAWSGFHPETTIHASP